MPSKIFDIDRLGSITFSKHRTAKAIRIRINGSDVKVTLPTWLAYSVAKAYVIKRTDWILENRKPVNNLYSGAIIGKDITLNIINGMTSRFSTKLKETELIIKIPAEISINSPEAQDKISKSVKKALQKQSYDILLPHVRTIADETNSNVKSIEIKDLKSRWGSCSSKNELTFSVYLIQLPWSYINYVIYHELAHTVHHNHGADFWRLVENFEPRYKQLRREMKHFSPQIIPQNINTM